MKSTQAAFLTINRPQIFISSNLRFLSLGTIDIWGWIIFCCGVRWHLGHCRGLAVSLASTHKMPVTHTHTQLWQLTLSPCMHVQWLSYVRLLVTLWTIACQAPLSMGFSRKEYWNGLPCPPPGNLLNPWIEPELPVSPASQGDSLPAEPLRKSDIAKCLRGMKSPSVKNHTALSQYICKGG